MKKTEEQKMKQKFKKILAIIEDKNKSAEERLITFLQSITILDELLSNVKDNLFNVKDKQNEA